MRPILKGSKVELYFLDESDRENLCDKYLDPEVYRTLARPHRPKNKTRVRSRIEGLSTSNDKVAFKIVPINEQEPVGLLILSNINHRAGRAELGYWIGKSKQRQGYATEAVGLVLRYAFERMNLNLVYAYVKEPNAISQRVLMKNGFKLVGRIPEYTIVPEYGHVALMIYAITKESRMKSVKHKF